MTPRSCCCGVDPGPQTVPEPDLESLDSAEVLLTRLAAAAEVRDDLLHVAELLHGRDPARCGMAIDELAEWLATVTAWCP
jgi:hypothetical protein